MAKSIEIVRFDDREISELAGQAWGNQEPGFQIDGVSSIEELYKVFQLVQAAAPTAETQAAMFDGVNPRDPDFEVMKNNGALFVGNPHRDTRRTGVGMAIHHNVAGRPKVALGFAKPRFYKTEMKMNRLTMSELRVGKTIPDRLTIFSLGGYDWLKPTVHQFQRKFGSWEWARYAQGAESETTDPELLKIIAASALARIATYAEAS
jgi:hypothetical protein